MTREDAIYLLRNTAWLAPSLEPVDEAIDMAINALEAMGNTQNTLQHVGSVEKTRGEAPERDTDYEQAVAQLEHDIRYEPTYNPEDGSM